MDYSIESYTHEQVLNVLKSSTRKVWYEYALLNAQDQFLGIINVEDASVSFDSTREVMRTFSGKVKYSDEFNMSKLDYRIIPWFCLKIENETVKWPLGKFLVETSEECDSGQRMIKIDGYDMAKTLTDDLISARFYVRANSPYTSTVISLINPYFANYDISQSAKSLGNDIEWDIGTSKLKIVNTLLSSISYNPLYIDEYGVPYGKAYVEPYLREIDCQYVANSNSIILDGVSKSTDMSSIPNKFVRYTESTDSAYLISTYINSDANSPYSTVNRGRTIVDSASVENIASQGDLDALVRKVALSSYSANETIEFKSLNMPLHSYQNCIFVNCDMYGISDKYIEISWEMDLTLGGEMKHKCRRAITL